MYIVVLVAVTNNSTNHSMGWVAPCSDSRVVPLCSWAVWDVCLPKSQRKAVKKHQGLSGSTWKQSMSLPPCHTGNYSVTCPTPTVREVVEAVGVYEPMNGVAVANAVLACQSVVLASDAAGIICCLSAMLDVHVVTPAFF